MSDDIRVVTIHDVESGQPLTVAWAGTGAPITVTWAGHESNLDDARVVVLDAPPVDPVGPGPGPAGPVVRLSQTVVASTIMSGHRVVTPHSTGSVRYADNTFLSDATKPLWLTTQAVESGDQVVVVTHGPVVEPSWSWSVGPVYLGTNGLLTQTLPTKGSGAVFCATVGYASSPTVLHVNREPSFVLA